MPQSTSYIDSASSAHAMYARSIHTLFQSLLRLRSSHLSAPRLFFTYAYDNTVILAEFATFNLLQARTKQVHFDVICAYDSHRQTCLIVVDTTFKRPKKNSKPQPRCHSRINFSTKPQDAENGLYYYTFRYYMPGTGRWASRDPIGERGGRNLYAMAGNNGVNRLDFLGLCLLDEKDKKEEEEKKKKRRQRRMKKAIQPWFGGGGLTPVDAAVLDHARPSFTSGLFGLSGRIFNATVDAYPLEIDAEGVVGEGSRAANKVKELLEERYACSGITQKVLGYEPWVQSDSIFGIGELGVKVVGIFESTSSEGLDRWNFRGVFIPQNQRFDFLPLEGRGLIATGLNFVGAVASANGHMRNFEIMFTGTVSQSFSGIAQCK